MLEPTNAVTYSLLLSFLKEVDLIYGLEDVTQLLSWPVGNSNDFWIDSTLNRVNVISSIKKSTINARLGGYVNLMMCPKRPAKWVGKDCCALGSSCKILKVSSALDSL